jgi:hypothetical protein
VELCSLYTAGVCGTSEVETEAPNDIIEHLKKVEVDPVAGSSSRLFGSSSWMLDGPRPSKNKGPSPALVAQCAPTSRQLSTQGRPHKDPGRRPRESPLSNAADLFIAGQHSVRLGMALEVRRLEKSIDCGGYPRVTAKCRALHLAVMSALRTLNGSALSIRLDLMLFTSSLLNEANRQHRNGHSSICPRIRR